MTDPLALYAYLVLARARVIDRAATLTPEQFAKALPIGLGSVAATLTHTVLAGERDWDRKISYTALLDENEKGPAWTITATPREIFTQLALHEVHHRSQVMAMLRQLCAPVEDLDFSAMTYARR